MNERPTTLSLEASMEASMETRAECKGLGEIGGSSCSASVPGGVGASLMSCKPLLESVGVCKAPGVGVMSRSFSSRCSRMYGNRDGPAYFFTDLSVISKRLDRTNN